MRAIICALLLLLTAVIAQAQPLKDQFNAFDYNRRLGQAVNLGNTLEAPNEGDWGFTLQSWHFEKIAQGGFDSVRVPIKWSGHADESAPYTIDQDFFERIDWVIQESKKNGLAAIVNVHHYDEISSDIQGHRERLNGIWSQIAERYKDEPLSSVYFEIMNEPNTAFTDGTWRSVYEQSLATIRETNPDRMVIVGGINWNNVSTLGRLRLPSDDPNLIGTFHYYNPFTFTHQGAEWVNNSEPWLGTAWSGTESEKTAVSNDFRLAQRWSERYDRPVFMGEFGAYSKADMESRAAWTEFVTNEAESLGFSWGYWEFGAGFGIINRTTRQWIDPLYDALSPTSLFNIDNSPGLNTADVDLLSALIAAGSTAERYDLDGDGQIAVRDLNYWVYFTGSMLGDTDLDQDVDFHDFLAFSGNFGQPATWSGGDFNADGQVDFGDFLVLSGNFVAESNPIASVPEPNRLPLALIACMCANFRGRRPQRR